MRASRTWCSEGCPTTEPRTRARPAPSAARPTGSRWRLRRTGARLLQSSVAPAPAHVAGRGGEVLAELRRVLSRLPADVAAATVYHHLDGMTHAEVAGLLGCSRRKVGYLLERAQRSLALLEQSA